MMMINPLVLAAIENSNVFNKLIIKFIIIIISIGNALLCIFQFMPKIPFVRIINLLNSHKKLNFLRYTTVNNFDPSSSTSAS